MAYDYQGLVNEVLLEVNEEELTTSAEFNAAVGMHKFVKSAVNWSINQICRRQDYEWPFLKATGTITCVPGQGDLSTAVSLTTAASYDWDSFYIANDPLLDEPDQRRLPWITLSKYREANFDRDVNSQASSIDTRAKPRYVVRNTDNKLILTPIPDVAYTVKYDYFRYNTQLSAYNDVPIIPEVYEHIIVKGALARVYGFLSDENLFQFTMKDFDDDIKDMRRILIPQEEAMRFIS